MTGRRLTRLEGTSNVYYVEELSWTAPVFTDRREAGTLLGDLLWEELGSVDAVFGLAAGGVPVALEVAARLGSCFDIVVVKKITYPWTTEAGFGAVAPDGSYDYDPEGAALAGYRSEDEVREAARRVRDYVVRRTMLVRGSTDYPRLDGKSVIVVDDGVATGYTMLVTAKFLRSLGADQIYGAAPTASVEGAKLVSKAVDRLIVINLRGGPVYAVADAYTEWHDVSDTELAAYMDEAGKRDLLCPWVKGVRVNP